MGRFAVFADPQGAVFAVYEGVRRNLARRVDFGEAPSS
jgi:hypothetical protein